MSKQIKRHILPLCHELLEVSPILIIQGARQVGKSTLAAQLAGPEAQIITLDDASQREFASSDPARFLQQGRGKTLIIDEVQRVPELTLQLKAAVDSNRTPGQFILTGSSQLLRTPGSGDSLAGRQETVILRPFSVGEKLGSNPEDFVSWLLDGASGSISAEDPTSFLIEGGYPIPLQRSTARTKNSWFSNYIDALATHDASEIAKGNFTNHLRSMLHYFASYGSTELVKKRLAQHLGSSESTIAHYIDLLQRMYLLEELPAWGLSYGSRVVRRPKVSLLDTGLASSISGFTAQKAYQAGGREHYGGLLEQFVVNELLKQQQWSETEYHIYHFRERNEEVDILIELKDGSLILLEVKSRSHVVKDQAKHLYSMRERLGDRVLAAAIIYTGEQTYQLEPWLWALPISVLWGHER